MNENERCDGLFAMEQVHLQIGQRVRVATIWGDELGIVKATGKRDDAGWPLITVVVASGDTITCSASRVTFVPVEER